MEENKEPKIVFDIVNSVKGGSGKSTVALQLAAFWASQTDTDAYIIDLDLRGTSWKANYEKYFVQDSNNDNKYINSLMYEFEPKDSVFWHLRVACHNAISQATSNANVWLCVGDPDISGDVDAVKIDLLESMVYKVFRYALAKSNDKKEVHIIFDMPPSYESHAERVVKHLLMDKESTLFKKYYKERRNAYHVNLFMIYAITGAHVEQNLIYTKNFFRQVAYSSAINILIDDNNYSLYFIGNDVSDALKTNPGSKSSILKKISDLFQDKKRPVLPDVSEQLKENLTKNLYVITHMDLLGPRNLEYFLDTAPKEATLRLMPEASDVFGRMFFSENPNP